MLKYRLSYWEKTEFYSQVDVAIIGSGIVGLVTAIELKRLLPDKHIYVFERGAGPIGASTRNAGFACVGSPSEILADIANTSFQAAVDLIAYRWEGLQRLRQLVGDEHIDLQMLGGYEMFTDDDTDIYKNCMDLVPELNQALRKVTGFDATYQEQHHEIKRFKLGSAEKLIFTPAEGQLNPGKLMSRLLQIAESIGVRIMNGIEIDKLEEYEHGVEIVTKFGWSIQSENVIVATNGFTANLLDGLDVRPVRNLVLVTHPIPGLALEGNFHYQEGYYYFRNVGDRILLGGGRNLDFDAEATQEFGINERLRSALTQFLRNVVSPHAQADPDMWWSGILGIGAEKKPIVSWYSNHIATAVRMGGMGVAIGSEVGHRVAHMVAKKMK
jgi:gamma-glutamylputrescine oxidase